MKVLFHQERHTRAQVAVLVSLYNYSRYIVEALDSVAGQTLADVELVVCNDCSTDDSATVAINWMEDHAERFSRIALIENDRNSGLSATRNASVSYAAAPFLFILDADNQLYPRCLERSLEVLREAPEAAAFVYAQRELFNERDQHGYALENLEDWNVEQLLRDNTIDAMVLHRRSALEAAGGYATDDTLGRLGKEDYELWLKYIRAGFYGIKIHQPLIRYRRHDASMIHTVTILRSSQRKIRKRLHELYPDLFSRR